MPGQTKATTPLHLWISLFPTAPLFGVEWQFAKFMPAATFFNPPAAAPKKSGAPKAATMKASKPVKPPKTNTVVEAVTVAEPVIEEAFVPSPAPAAVEASCATAGPSFAPPATLYETAPTESDDLKQLKGVGPKLEAMLNAMGIYRFDQIAAFTPENLAWVDDNLTAFKGRPIRDDWVAQAQALL